MNLVVIPCSNHKSLGGDTKYDPKRSIVFSLPGSFGMELVAYRKELAITLDIPLGSDIGADTSASFKFMPALERYTGNLYRAANIQLEDLNRLEGKYLLIVSALYGLVLPNEPIRFYDVSMTTKLSSGIKVATWWRRHNLGKLINAVATSIEASEICDLLSNDYRQAVSPWFPPSNLSSYPTPDFQNLGQGINYHRGKALRKILLED